MARVVYREMRSLAVHTAALARCDGLYVSSGWCSIECMAATEAVPTSPSSWQALTAEPCGGVCALDLSLKIAPSAHVIHGTRRQLFHASPQSQQTSTLGRQARPSIEAFIYSKNIVAAGRRRTDRPASSMALYMQRRSLANCACDAR